MVGTEDRRGKVGTEERRGDGGKKWRKRDGEHAVRPQTRGAAVKHSYPFPGPPCPLPLLPRPLLFSTQAGDHFRKPAGGNERSDDGPQRVRPSRAVRIPPGAWHATPAPAAAAPTSPAAATAAPGTSFLLREVTPG